LRLPLYVQELMILTDLLEHFRKADSALALIVNEYGDIEGLVTLMDVLTAIAGEFPSISAKPDFEVVRRADGSWLIDGGLPISQLKSVIGMSGNYKKRKNRPQQQRTRPITSGDCQRGPEARLCNQWRYF